MIEHNLISHQELSEINPETFLTSFLETTKSSAGYRVALERLTLRLMFDIVALNQDERKEMNLAFTYATVDMHLPCLVSNHGSIHSKAYSLMRRRAEGILQSLGSDLLALFQERGYKLQIIAVDASQINIRVKW